MSEQDMSGAERPDEILAAEYVLGLLEGEELLAARGRLVREPQFARAVAFWEDRLAALLDEIGAAEPGPDLWDRIQAEIDKRSDGSGSAEIVTLQKRLRNWQFVAGLSAAAAVAALSLFVLAPGQTPGPVPGPSPVATSSDAPAGATLVATVPIEGTPLNIDLTYLPESHRLLVSAAGLTHDGVHDHELWLVRPGGGVESLGVVTPGETRSHSVPDKFVSDMTDGAKLLLTREPLGGRINTRDAGPVVAEGTFHTI
jgi:anti-sigma-K factor RskA